MFDSSSDWLVVVLVVFHGSIFAGDQMMLFLKLTGTTLFSPDGFHREGV